MSIAEKIQAIIDGLANNKTEITIGTQTVKYRSVSEMKEALRILQDMQAKEQYGYAGKTVQAVSGRRFIQ